MNDEDKCVTCDFSDEGSDDSDYLLTYQRLYTQ